MRLSAIAVGLGMLLMLCGCQGESPQAEPATPKVVVKRKVLSYTALLADGYENLNMNHLVQVATEGRALKAFYHMASLGEARVRMLATLEAIEIGEISFPQEGNARVQTEEIWTYRYQDVDTGEERFDNRVDYTLVYSLIKKEEEWLVAEVEVMNAVEEKPSTDQVRFFKRPPTDPHPGAPKR